MTRRMILYGTKKCPAVRPVRDMLDRAGVLYEYVDAGENPAAKIRLQEINDGYESVPTLVFPDDSTLTEPSLVQLRARLEAEGYSAPHIRPWQAWRAAPIQSLLGAAMIVFGLWDPSWLFVLIGVLLLIFIPTRAYFER